MLSAIPAISPSDPAIGNPFSNFENRFIPWDGDLFSAVTQSAPPKPVVSSSGSDEMNQKQTNSNSGCDETKPPASVIDERKQRRMLSNRESARRSRMRKQRHLENLRSQLNRLKMENRELTNRLQFVLFHWQRVRTDNDRLRSEHSLLRRKLSELRELLMFRQLQQFTSAWACSNVTS